jgi:hypothetical protein
MKGQRHFRGGLRHRHTRLFGRKVRDHLLAKEAQGMQIQSPARVPLATSRRPNCTT